MKRLATAAFLLFLLQLGLAHAGNGGGDAGRNGGLFGRLYEVETESKLERVQSSTLDQVVTDESSNELEDVTE